MQHWKRITVPLGVSFGIVMVLVGTEDGLADKNEGTNMLIFGFAALGPGGWDWRTTLGTTVTPVVHSVLGVGFPDSA